MATYLSVQVDVLQTRFKHLLSDSLASITKSPRDEKIE